LPEGYLIISGIIEQDAKAIEENFSAAQLIPAKVITEKEWLCYVLRKKAV
jgi:ribosomal protein L11 methyltransferase